MDPNTKKYSNWAPSPTALLHEIHTVPNEKDQEKFVEYSVPSNCEMSVGQCFQHILWPGHE